MLTVLTVVGARPQFVKASAVSSAISRRNDVTEIVLHTGQHYDEAMSGSQFADLGMSAPDHHLRIGSGSHGTQTTRMLEGIEAACQADRPGCVLVYDDTNSTIAAALAASKLGIPVVHVEAGLRSFDRSMPEEINRVVTDHLSSLLLCPSGVAVRNLAAEGITAGVHVVGDVMYDVLLRTAGRARPSAIAAQLARPPGTYIVATVHRPSNTDDADRLRAIWTGFERLAAAGHHVVWPVHPRTRAQLTGIPAVPGVHLVEPLPYSETIALLRDASAVVTDSGGLQKEAYWLGVPCLTVRDNTEWTETVDEGWNRLVRADPSEIVDAVEAAKPGEGSRSTYGDGRAADRIVDLTVQTFSRH